VISEYQGKFRSILLFGPPGSGKGTLGKILASAGGQYHLSSGDLLRGLSPKSAAGQLFHSYAVKGEFAPDETMIEIWHHYMMGLIATNRYFPEEQFLLLDGLPRTVGQVELTRDHLDVERILVLDVAEEELLARLQRRASLENRSDDVDPQVLHRRMEVYRDQTAQILDHYPKEVIEHIDASGTPIQVLREVLIHIGDLLASFSRPPGT
jgi:adenylate kinase